MAFKDLFIKNDETAEKPKTTAPVSAPVHSNTNLKFPNATEQASPAVFGDSSPSTPTPSFSYTPTTPVNTGGVTSEALNKALEIYQKGFDSLNQPGFDFYEFYQSVTNAGVTNPQIYSMAFSMANGMDKTVTKEKLVQQGEFYINEITKQYDDFVAQGNGKKQEIESQKTHENQSLVNELDLMNQQMESLKTQIEDSKRKLADIGTKYDPQISAIVDKLSANSLAKDKIISSIEQVKQGILTNLK
jgi:polyhydroxyalkanoate synthesis regulator phasin